MCVFNQSNFRLIQYTFEILISLFQIYKSSLEFTGEFICKFDKSLKFIRLRSEDQQRLSMSVP